MIPDPVPAGAKRLLGIFGPLDRRSQSLQDGQNGLRGGLLAPAVERVEVGKLDAVMPGQEAQVPVQAGFGVAWYSWRDFTVSASSFRARIPATAAAAAERVVIQGTPCWVAALRM